MHGSHAEEMLAGDGPRVDAPFQGLDEHAWTWARTLTRLALLDMVASRSYVITASDAERARILAAVGDLFDERRRAEPQGAGDGAETITLPYVTRAYRGIRP
jgi:hypothetical protein